MQHLEKAPKSKQDYFKKLQKKQASQNTSLEHSSPQVGFIGYITLSDNMIYLDTYATSHIVNN